MVRFFFFLLISLPVFADCPTGESIGSYPLSTPTSFCADYIGSNCLAVCGWASDGSVAACVGSATQQGPYRLTGSTCTPSDGGGDPVDCAVNPVDESCWPDPSAPLTPDSPECKYLPTSLYPQCQDTSSGNPADGIGSYMDSNGKWRELRINTGLKDTIITSAKGVQDEVSKLSQKFGNEFSTSNNLLNEINNNILASKDAAINASSSTNDYLSNIKSLLDNPASGSSGTGSPLDYSTQLSDITNVLNNMYYYDSQMNSSLYSMRWDTNNLNGMKQSLYNMEDYLSKISSQLSNSASSGSSTGNDGGNSSSDIGSSSNPAHLDSASYIRCSDCTFDIQGATQRLEESKSEFSKTIDEIKDRAGDIFSFNLEGSNEVSDCYDILPDWVGKSVCVNTGSLWSILGSIIFIICVMVAFYIVMGRD